jgi:hypothetical protein
MEMRLRLARVGGLYIWVAYSLAGTNEKHILSPFDLSLDTLHGLLEIVWGTSLGVGRREENCKYRL